MAKEMVMTRSDVKKLAWTLRLIGFGMLAGAAALVFVGGEHASAAQGRVMSARLTR
jgi:hypothetical protein